MGSVHSGKSRCCLCQSDVMMSKLDSERFHVSDLQFQLRSQLRYRWTMKSFFSGNTRSEVGVYFN